MFMVCAIGTIIWRIFVPWEITTGKWVHKALYSTWAQIQDFQCILLEVFSSSCAGFFYQNIQVLPGRFSLLKRIQRNFLFTQFSSFTVSGIVKTTTSGAANDRNFVKLTTFPFQCSCYQGDFLLWNGNDVILTKFLYPVPSEFVKIRTSGTVSDDNFVSIATFAFQCFHLPSITVVDTHAKSRLLRRERMTTSHGILWCVITHPCYILLLMIRTFLIHEMPTPWFLQLWWPWLHFNDKASPGNAWHWCDSFIVNPVYDISVMLAEQFNISFMNGLSIILQ